MILNKLIAKDFLTYSHLEYDFENKPLLVQGLNLTDDGQQSNGSGKSGIQTAIEFCITASNSRDVRDLELVTFGKSEANVQLFASCDCRKESIHISWIIRIKGSNQLEFRRKKYGEVDWVDVSFSNVNDGKKAILDWFAISKEDLFNYYIINKTRFKSFFKSSNREKVDLINRFSDASIIEGLEDIDLTKLQSSHKEAEKLVHITEGKVEHVNQLIESELNRDFESELKEDISNISEEIEEIEEKIASINKNIDLIPNRIVQVNTIIEGFKEDIKTAKADKIQIENEIKRIDEKVIDITKEFEDAIKNIEAFQCTNWREKRGSYIDGLSKENEALELEKSRIEKFERQKTALLKLLQTIEVKLGGAIECPKCNHTFLLDGNIEELYEEKLKLQGMSSSLNLIKNKSEDLFSKLKANIANIELELSKINALEQVENQDKNTLTVASNLVADRLSKIKLNIQSLHQELRSCDSDINNYQASINTQQINIKNIENEKSNYQNQIKQHQSEIKSFKNDIKGLKVGNSEEYIKVHKLNLSALESDLMRFRLNLQMIGDEIYKTNQWINNFKQFRMYVANQSLEVIEYHCNRYLSEMGSDLRIKMDGFRLLSSGTYKDEITALIIRETERTFSSFSGGEQGRLLFASILANRHMINETHPYGGLDFLSIDEVFEGVDAMGLKDLVKSAKALKVAVMIITHVTDENASGDTLLIVKENGISKIRKSII